MTIKILPQEFLFAEHMNPIQVQTACSKELLDDPKMYLPHLKHFNLAAGTVVLVQVMNETKDKLLHEADFRVTGAVKALHGVEDDYGSKVREQTTYGIERWSEWRSSEFGKTMEDVVEPADDVEKEVKWNPGAQAYQVVKDGAVVKTIERIEGEGKEDYKARAHA